MQKLAHSLLRSSTLQLGDRSVQSGLRSCSALVNWVSCPCHTRFWYSPTARQLCTAPATRAVSNKRSAPQQAAQEPSGQVQPAAAGGKSARLYEDDAHLLKDSHISKSAWEVMADLRRAGHEVYVVGGTVRDIMLQGTPKDLDILTTATPRQIKKLFRRCLIVGRRFPVAHVRMGDVLLEVSSFDTSATPDLTPLDAAAMLSKLQNGSNSFGKHAPLSVARRHNALARDFTVNALLYDPFSRVLYDYVDGVKDLQRRMLRCIGDPRKSFQQDPARMLRAIRLAARADLKLDEGAAAAIRELGPLTLALPSGRLQMELTSMMAHGAAARSIQLLWQFDLLDLMLPVHAAYLRDQKHPRQVKRARTDPLFQMLEQMDRHIQPHHPVGSAVWVAVLALPLLRHAQQYQQQAQQAASGQQRRGRPRKNALTEPSWMQALQPANSHAAPPTPAAAEQASTAMGQAKRVTVQQVVEALLRPQPCRRAGDQSDKLLATLLPKGPAALAVRSLQQRDGKSRGPSQDSTTTDEDEAPPDRGNLTWEQRRGLERRRKPKRNDNILQAVLQACNRAALSAV